MIADRMTARVAVEMTSGAAIVIGAATSVRVASATVRMKMIARESVLESVIFKILVSCLLKNSISK